MEDTPQSDLSAVEGQAKFRSKRPLLKFALRAVVTLAAIVYLIRKIDWADFLTGFTSSDPTWLVLALVAFGAAYLLAAARWWYLLRVQLIRIPMSTVVAVTFIGQFFNSFMLGAVGGDVVRSVYILGYAPRQRTHATLSIILDRALGMFVLLFAAVLTLPFGLGGYPLTPQTKAILHSILLVFVGFVGLGVLFAVFPFRSTPQWIQQWWRRVPYHHVAELIVGGYRAHQSSPVDTCCAIGAAILVTLVVVVAGSWIAKGIHLDVPLVAMLQILTVAICIVSLPISIGGHGVREGVFLFMFSAYGVTQINSALGSSRAVLFSLIFYFLSAAWSIVGGVIYFFYKARPRINGTTDFEPTGARMEPVRK